MSSNEILIKLRKLGLSNYEAKAYIALIEYGPLTANELSAIAMIPYSKIYEALSKLREKGWINVEGGKPKKYFAKPPIESIKKSLSKIEREFSELGRNLIDELQPIYDRIYVQEKPEVIILRGATSIINRVLKSLDRVNSEIEVAIPFKSKLIYGLIRDRLFSYALKGISIKVLVNIDQRESFNDLVNYGIEVRFREKMFGGGLIIDEREALILLGGEDNSLIAIWSNHSELVKLARIYFNYLWKDAVRY